MLISEKLKVYINKFYRNLNDYNLEIVLSMLKKAIKEIKVYRIMRASLKLNNFKAYSPKHLLL